MAILVVILLTLCVTLTLLLIWTFKKISAQSWEILALRAAIDAGRVNNGKFVGQSE